MISNKNDTSLDNVCSLIAITSTENEYGEPTAMETSKDIFCAELPVTSNEFFSAQQSGFKVQKCLVVNSDEYTEERLIGYEGKRYSVYRYYQRADGYTELYCAERVGNG